MEKQNFINLIGMSARKVCIERGYGNAQIWTCIAQACCESNYGRSKLMKGANAFFGIKATPSWVKNAKYGGKVFSAKTNECYDGKTLTQITDKFRAYDNLDDSVRDYFDLLEMSRYKNSLTKNTVKEAITEIKNGGYATSPTYINTICKFYNADKKLIESFKIDKEPKNEEIEVKIYVYLPQYKGTSGSIIDSLKSLNLDSSKSYRAELAKLNGIIDDVTEYKSTYKQNVSLLKLLKEGKLIGGMLCPDCQKTVDM